MNKSSARRLPAIAVFLPSILLLSALVPCARAYGDPSSGCERFGGITCPTQSTDGWVYAYDVETMTDIAIPKSAAGNPGPTMTYRYALSPACFQGSPFDAVDCSAASQYCASVAESGLHEDVWRSDELSNFTNWRIVGDLCTGGLPDPVPTQQIIDDAHEYERDHMPPGVPLVQPGNVAIVNIPVLASVPPLQQQAMDVQLPIPGELIATPSYSWTFDDGTTMSGAGTPYDGADPRTNPGHYAVAHTYTKAQAQASVSLTVTWKATFTAAGQTINIPDVVMPPITTTFTVDEAHAVLVSG